MLFGKSRDSIATLTGNFTYALGQFLVLLIFARFAGLEELGLYSLALAITAPLQLGLSMNMRSVRVVEDPRAHPFNAFISLSLGAGFVAVSFATLIGIAFFGPSTEMATLVAVAGMKAVESLFEVLYGEIQRNGRLNLVAHSQCIRSALVVVIALVVLADGGRAWVLATVTVATMTILLVTYQIPVLHRVSSERFQLSLTLRASRVLFAKTWPLGISAGLTSLNGSLPRIVAFPILGAETSGVLALVSYPAVIMAMLGNSLGQSILVPMREARRHGSYEIVTAISRRPKWIILGFGLIISLGILVVGSGVIGNGLDGVDRITVLAATAFFLAATSAGLAAIAYYELTSAGVYRYHPILSGAITVIALPLLILGSLYGGLIGTGLAVLIYSTIQYSVWMTASEKAQPATT
jgi:O-antigen/teichoic acid export membrane protein